MPRHPDNKIDRDQLQIPPAQTQTIARQAVVDAAEVTNVPVHDFVRILDLIEYPPRPNKSLQAAIAALPDKFCDGSSTCEALNAKSLKRSWARALCQIRPGKS